GDAVVVPHNANLDPGAGSFTVEAWINTSQATGDQMIVQKAECSGSCPPSANSLYELYLVNGILNADLRDSDAGGPDGNGAHVVAGTVSLADGLFHHVAM